MTDTHKKGVLITGGSGGIGRAAAKLFAGAGYKVVISSRRRDVLSEIASTIPGCMYVVMDLSDDISVRQAFSEAEKLCGGIDVLICNAATIIVSEVLNTDSSDLMNAFRANVCGHLLLIQLSIRAMKHRSGGHILCVGSPGFMMGIPFYASYATSKAAFSGLVRTLQAENNDPRIKISEYFPGYVATDSPPVSRIGPVEQDFLMGKGKAGIKQWFARPQSPEEIGKQLLYLDKNPKLTVFSSAIVRLGALLSLFPRIRYRLAGSLAQNAREKMKLQPQKS